MDLILMGDWRASAQGSIQFRQFSTLRFTPEILGEIWSYWKTYTLLESGESGWVEENKDKIESVQFLPHSLKFGG